MGNRLRITTAVLTVLLGASLGVFSIGGAAFLRARRSPPSFDVIEKAAPLLIDSPQNYSHTFVVRNPTNKPVRILKVRPGCSCEHSELQTDVLPPGQSTPLTLSKLTGPPTGIRFLGVTVITDYAERPAWHYAVEIPVYARYSVTPDRLVFGSVEPGATVSRSFTIETYDDGDSSASHVEAVSTDSLHVVADGDPISEPASHGLMRGARSYHVQLCAGTVPGDFNEVVSFRHESARLENLVLLCSWHIPSAIEVSPASGAFFGKVAVGEEPLKRTVIVQSAETPFRIIDCTNADPPILRVEYDADAKMRHMVRVTIDPAAVRGVLAGELSLIVDHPKQHEVKIKYAVAGG